MFTTRLTNIINLNKIAGTNRRARLALLQCQQNRLKSDLYEPDYLISMEPDEPVYDCLNLQIKGYDFALLESAQKQIHKYAEVMGVQVDECWATPAQQLKVQRFKPGGTVLDEEYKLYVYERNIQVREVPAWALGTVLRACRGALPEGCALSVHEHARHHEEARYVPDNQLLDLKQQLEGMGGSRTHYNKRK